MMSDAQKQRPAEGYSKDQLEAAKIAEFISVPKTAEAKCFVSELEKRTLEFENEFAPRPRQRRASDAKKFRGAVGAFAADLICHASNHDASGFLYRSANREALADTLVSSRSFDQLVRYWQSMGLLEATGYIHVKLTFDGERTNIVDFARARRFRATDLLLALAESHSVTPESIADHFEKDLTLVLEVIVRAEKRSVGGQKIPSPNIRVSGIRYEAEAQRVRELNRYLRTSGFDLSDPPRVYRLFNRGDAKGFDFNMGGRLYCSSDHNWQDMPFAQRSKITWQGEPTVELDVRSSHLFILSVLRKQPIQIGKDPYQFPGIERDVAKGLIVAILGNGSVPKRWPKEMNQKYLAKNGLALSKKYKLSEVVEKLRARYPFLDTVEKGKLDWARLQYEESECFVEAMLDLGSRGVAVLPVHDSLIVAKRHCDIARETLGLAYQDRFGTMPNIVVK